MEGLFLEVLNMSLTASLLIVAVFFVRLLLKKAPRWSVCLLWAFVGIKLICPNTIESVFSLIPKEKPIPQDIMMMQQPAIDTGIPLINERINPVILENFTPNPYNSVNPLQVVNYVAGIVWLMGIGVLLIYAAVSYLKLYRKVRASVKTESNIYLCDDVDTPFILGVVRPKIYMPSGLTETEMKHVLAHEQAHLKRKDYLWKPLGFLILTIHWFNPLVWFSYVFLCKDIELACDEKAIRDQEKEEAISYSQTLLSCSVSRRNILMCPLAFGEVSVKERIKHVLHYKKPAFWVVLVAVVVCLVIGICFLTNPKQDKKAGENGQIRTENQSEGVKDNLSEAEIQSQIEQELQNAVDAMETEKQEIVNEMLAQNQAAVNGISRPILTDSTKEDILNYLAALPDDTEGLVNEGVMVLTYNTNYGIRNLREFQTKYQAKEQAIVVIAQYTVEGDIILEYLSFDGKTISILSDYRRDKWAGDSEKVATANFPYFSIFEWTALNGDIYEELVLHKDADFDHEKMQEMMVSSQIQTGEPVFDWVGSFCNGNTHAEIDHNLTYHEVATIYDESQDLCDRSKVCYLILTDATTGESRQYSVLDGSNAFNEMMDCIYSLDITPNTDDDAYRSGKKYMIYLCDENKDVCQIIAPYQDAVMIDYKMFDGSMNGTCQHLLLQSDDTFCGSSSHITGSESHSEEHTTEHEAEQTHHEESEQHDTEQTHHEETEKHVSEQTHHEDQHKNHH